MTPPVVLPLSTDEPEIRLEVFVPERPSGAATLICPGGGYRSLCADYEGRDVARWLNRLGITAAVLHYHVGAAARHPRPFQDGAAAAALLRDGSAEYRFAPDRLGVMGFSAGGHLAAMLATAPELRFAFQLLIYPVITMGSHTHPGSREALLGPSPAPEEIAALSAEKRVTPLASPAFVCHAVTDASVPVVNSREYVAALNAAGVPCAYLELPSGAHGLGRGRGAEWEAWQRGASRWLTSFLAGR